MAYTENEVRALIIESGLRLLETELIARTWGNISARISDTEFIITPSGRAYDGLTPEDLVKVKIADCSYEGNIKPSSEKGIHASAYALRKDINFIIHTHQFYASAVCAEGEDVPFAPCAAYGLPSTKALRKNVVETIKQHPVINAFLMAHHGALCLGKDVESAFAAAVELERKCKKLFDSRVTVEGPTANSSFTFGTNIKHPFVQHDTYAMVLAISKRGRKLPAYLDDFAQIIGPTARCTIASAKSAVKALKGRNAVLLKDEGALCVADTADDVEAVSMILRKNCAAALYTRKAKTLGLVDTWVQRIIYLKKYSRRRDG